MSDLATIGMLACGGAIVLVLVAIYGGRQKTSGLTPELNQLRAQQQARRKNSNVDFAWDHGGGMQTYGHGQPDDTPADSPVVVVVSRQDGPSIYEQMNRARIAQGLSNPFETLPQKVIDATWRAEANAEAAAKITAQARAQEQPEPKPEPRPESKPSGLFEMEYRREWEK